MQVSWSSFNLLWEFYFEAGDKVENGAALLKSAGETLASADAQFAADLSEPGAQTVCVSTVYALRGQVL